MKSSTYDVIVVGGGAAGMMASIIAARRGARVLLLERNEFTGQKLRITGKGRCNVTNDCEPDVVIRNTPTGGKFLHSALAAFPPSETKAFFEKLGVPLKTERGGRVFPVSDKASDIVDALVRYCGAVTFRHEKVLGIRKEDEFEVKTSKGVYRFDRVIIATGGLSYPRTGSDGDGYGFAAAFGHRIIGTSPSLVPLICEEDLCPRCQGLTLKNVTLSALDTSKNKTVFSELGEMLFTDKGVSGPLVLSASAHMKDITPGKYALYIDLKPALDEQTLDRRILRDFSEQKNKNLINSLHDLLPSKLIAPFVELTGIDPDKKVNSVTVSDRRKILELLKKLPLTVVSAAPVAEAIITRGGVDTRQIDSKTMQSKLVPGLYFAGEVIDCDAYTGGFNLQIAFSTANAAAVAASGVIT